MLLQYLKIILKNHTAIFKPDFCSLTGPAYQNNVVIKRATKIEEQAHHERMADGIIVQMEVS